MTENKTPVDAIELACTREATRMEFNMAASQFAKNPNAANWTRLEVAMGARQCAMYHRDQAAVLRTWAKARYEGLGEGFLALAELHLK